jgi:hypothetical protein
MHLLQMVAYQHIALILLLLVTQDSRAQNLTFGADSSSSLDASPSTQQLSDALLQAYAEGK